jgi:hypothetical protein
MKGRRAKNTNKLQILENNKTYNKIVDIYKKSAESTEYSSMIESGYKKMMALTMEHIYYYVYRILVEHAKLRFVN